MTTKLKGGFFAYYRTSTVRQGTEGVSLNVQTADGNTFARAHGFVIKRRWVEMETAAKRGRPQFDDMMCQLRKGEAEGVIFHKIDRGARNLRDWSDITELLDLGIKVYFVKDPVDLNTRGGRLTADMLAAVSADFIRNLKYETTKGLEGRLAQGLWPFRAPAGYLDQGKGQVKALDPITAPLIRKAFELYASGAYSIQSLRKRLFTLGLRTRSGKAFSKNALNYILRNKFYVGLMKQASTGLLFKGKHEPLVTLSVFERVQDVLNGRFKRINLRHAFLYRRDITCLSCRCKLIGERQKGHVYYRCHKPSCKGTSLREESFSEAVKQDLLALGHFFALHPNLSIALSSRLRKNAREKEDALAAYRLQLAQLQERETAAVDALIEGLIDKAAFGEKKNQLSMARGHIEEKITEIERNGALASPNAVQYLELVEALRGMDFLSSPRTARAIAKSATSNLGAARKTPVISWGFPFDEAIKSVKSQWGAYSQDTSRTLEEWVELFMSADAPVAVPRQRPLVPLSQDSNFDSQSSASEHDAYAANSEASSAANSSGLLM